MSENYVKVIEEDKVEGKPLGRHVNHDPRSLSFRIPFQPARALTSVRHVRRIPVLDQGDLGSCTGNAAVGAVGTDPLYTALGATHPSLDEALAVKIYSRATQIDPYSGSYPPNDTGSDGLSAAKAAKEQGLISGYLHATDINTMQSALQDTPVIVGVNWYSGFDTPNSAGVVKLSGYVRGGHEFVVDEIDTLNKRFGATNSWGTGYGLNGRFYFSFADMERLLSEDGDCTQLLPVTIPVPTPTPTPVVTATPEDIQLAQLLDAWEKNIFSRLTKAGKVKTYYDNTWKPSKGL